MPCVGTYTTRVASTIPVMPVNKSANPLIVIIYYSVLSGVLSQLLRIKAASYAPVVRSLVGNTQTEKRRLSLGEVMARNGDQSTQLDIE